MGRVGRFQTVTNRTRFQMSASEMLKLKCLHCHEPIEAVREALGTVIDCVHCGHSTTLTEEPDQDAGRLAAENGFLRICREIWSDGELTSEEVWLMAEWLNDNPDDGTIWPGTVIFPLLQNAFSDGIVSEAEMLSLASALSEIERESSRRAHGFVHKPPAPVSNTAYVIRKQDIAEVALPEIVYKTQITSSDGSSVYEVDLGEYKCECRDWISKRSGNQPRTLGRCCKHVVAALMESEEVARFGPIFRAVLDDCDDRGRGTDPCDQWFTVRVKGTQGLISLGNGDWSNVFVEDNDSWARYSYHLQEKRWSYGEAPSNATGFALAIGNLAMR
jgi:hypothetical protein